MAINLCITYTEVVAVVGGWILHRQMSSYRSIPWKQWTSAPCGASVHYFQGMERYSDILLYEILKKIWARWKFLWQTGWRTDGRTNYNKNFSEDELKSSLIRAHDTAEGPDKIHYQLLKHLPAESKSLLRLPTCFEITAMHTVCCCSLLEMKSYFQLEDASTREAILVYWSARKIQTW